MAKSMLAGPDTLAKSADAISGFLQHLRVNIVFFTQRAAEAVAFLQPPVMLSRENTQSTGRTGRHRNKCILKEYPLTRDAVESRRLNDWISEYSCMRPRPVIRHEENDIGPVLLSVA